MWFVTVLFAKKAFIRHRLAHKKRSTPNHRAQKRRAPCRCTPRIAILLINDNFCQIRILKSAIAAILFHGLLAAVADHLDALNGYLIDHGHLPGGRICVAAF